MLYLRLPRLLQEMPIAQGDGRYPKLMAALAKTDLVVLDDWGLAVLSDENRRDVLELLEDRHGRRAPLVTSQLPLEHWHEALGDPTLADAILDRLVHHAYKIALTGDSMRKQRAPDHSDSRTTSLGAGGLARQDAKSPPLASDNRQTTSVTTPTTESPMTPSTCASTSRTNNRSQDPIGNPKEDRRTHPSEQRRQQAIARYLAGDPIEAICYQMACSKSWLYKWKARYQPDDPDWARERSRKPKTPAATTPPLTQQAVVNLHQTLVKQGQRGGAATIRQALKQQGLDPLPALRTIYRILQRHRKEVNLT